jgi:hypothetical protein
MLEAFEIRWIYDDRYILTRDNLVYLVILWILFIYIYTIYADVIVDITPQLITLNQRSKSDKYHKNKHSSI